MSDTEGTIHFAYDLKPAQSPVVEPGQFAILAAWRRILTDLGLLGQTPDRYQGLGFGNLSARDMDRSDEFVITASQTSGVSGFSAAHLTRVTHCSLERFWVDAIGDQPPSSETLTHAMVYAADPHIEWVFHCHSADIWQGAEQLTLPGTAPAVGYGTPEMVRATSELLEAHRSRPLVFVTHGHQDGVFACGPSARDAGGLLVSYLARALAL